MPRLPTAPRVKTASELYRDEFSSSPSPVGFSYPFTLDNLTSGRLLKYWTASLITRELSECEKRDQPTKWVATTTADKPLFDWLMANLNTPLRTAYHEFTFKNLHYWIGDEQVDGHWKEGKYYYVEVYVAPIA